MGSILVTGGCGFIGSKLVAALIEKGYRVHVVDIAPPRKPIEGVMYHQLNLVDEDIPKELQGNFDAVIHLAGVNIFGRWTSQYKQLIYDSRIESTKRLVTSFRRWDKKPKVFISASAFGYYGDTGEEQAVDEQHKPGKDFLAEVCIDWERESKAAEAYGVRTVQVRTAHVLGQYGFLRPLRMPFKLGLGATIGFGRQWLPWVHVEDIVRIYIHALETNSLEGPVNTAAPDNVRQKTFMQAFARSLNRPMFLRLPIWLLQLRYGELAQSFTNSCRTSSSKLFSSGFTHKFADLNEALKDVTK